jgi:bla regulator protein BlaR1
MDMARRLVLLPLCITLVGLRASAQSGERPLGFEIASVKPADPTIRTSNVLLGAGESLTIVNVPLRKIIMYAYDIRDFQLAGGPGWVGDERYDITAKTTTAEHASFEATAETDDQRRSRVARVRERLRSLLSDRFGLSVHMEGREQTILALRIAKGGPKLAEAAANTGRVSTVDGHIQGFGAPISMLATQLSIATGLIVADETDLRGKYDFVLDWAPDGRDQRDTRPSIFSAVGEQLGLRLERAKGPVKTVVIDHVERPSAN